MNVNRQKQGCLCGSNKIQTHQNPAHKKNGALCLPQPLCEVDIVHGFPTTRNPFFLLVQNVYQNHKRHSPDHAKQKNDHFMVSHPDTPNIIHLVGTVNLSEKYWSLGFIVPDIYMEKTNAWSIQCKFLSTITRVCDSYN